MSQYVSDHSVSWRILSRATTPPSGRLPGTAMAHVSNLPGLPITLGPYTVLMTTLARGKMPDRRRLADVSVERHLFALREDLEGRRLALEFLRTLIRFIHYSRGCQGGCVEEAYTQSLATGLVEFAQRNPAAWTWFNELLDDVAARPDFARIAMARTGQVEAPPPPRRFLVDGALVTLASISTRQAGGCFGFFVHDESKALLWEHLCGPTLAVVAIHEFTHAIHARAGVANGSSHIAFRDAEAGGWLRFALANPAAWRWLVYLMTHEASRPPVPRVDLAA